METTFTDAELIAFLDETLGPERSTQLENQLKSDRVLQNRLLVKRSQQAAGLHTLGGIWQRTKASCPSREDLNSFLKETLAPSKADYIRFHLIEIGCRYCQANSADLLGDTTSRNQLNSRRERFFQTSAGYLPPRVEKQP